MPKGYPISDPLPLHEHPIACGVSGSSTFKVHKRGRQPNHRPPFTKEKQPMATTHIRFLWQSIVILTIKVKIIPKRR